MRAQRQKHQPTPGVIRAMDMSTHARASSSFGAAPVETVSAASRGRSPQPVAVPQRRRRWRQNMARMQPFRSRGQMVAPNGGPLPAASGCWRGGGTSPLRLPCLPNYACRYAAYPNYAAVTYPKQYHRRPAVHRTVLPLSKVPLGWRDDPEWDDGWWFLDFAISRRVAAPVRAGDWG